MPRRMATSSFSSRTRLNSRRMRGSTRQGPASALAEQVLALLIAERLAGIRIDLLAQRLRREAVTAQQVGRQTFAFLGEPDQEMLRPDIRVAEFVGGHESTAERVLDPGRHADLALERLVATLLAGPQGGDGTGVAGVAWSVQMLAVKSFNAGANGTPANAALGINYITAISIAATGERFAAINMSFGGTNSNAALTASVEAAASAGILSVAAAGNNARDIDVTPFNPAVIAIMPPWYMHRKERLVQNANAH